MTPFAQGAFCSALFVAVTGLPAGAQEPPNAAASLCADRPGCRVDTVQDAGSDASGSPLQVAVLALPDADTFLPCRPHAQEYWVLAEGRAPEQILGLCNDGYGAARLGEDRVRVGDNRLAHDQSGGSNWRWTVAQTLQLSPLRVIEESLSGSWTLGPNEEIQRWDWRTLSGETEWWAPLCSSQEGVPEHLVEVSAFRFRPIPMLAPEMVPDTVVDAALGTCALRIGSGDTIWGDPDDGFAEDEWMRVAMIGPEELIVSLRQADWARGADNWLHDDHLELWLGPRVSYFHHCIGEDEQPVQWAILPFDDRVIPAHGNPTAAPRVVARQVTEEVDATVVTLRILLPEPVAGITVVFSRGDGEARQVWMTATSQVAFGDAASLGRTRLIHAEVATCTVRDGWLDLVDSGLPPAIHGLQ